jgi:hypothetical protein
MNAETLDKEFARAAYDAHHSLFRHYSEQIFKTRISIITLSSSFSLATFWESYPYKIDLPTQ